MKSKITVKTDNQATVTLTNSNEGTLVQIRGETWDVAQIVKALRAAADNLAHHYKIDPPQPAPKQPSAPREIHWGLCPNGSLSFGGPL